MKFNSEQNKENSGFTLIELLLTLSILGILVSFTIPIGMDFYENRQLNTTADRVVQELRSSQFKAMIQNDNSFGVKLKNDPCEYIYFEGTSYSTSQYENSFSCSDLINFSGLNEVTFSPFSGQPDVTGNITISINNENMTININNLGLINLN